MDSNIRVDDIKYMKLALTLARKGKGSVFPNPMVGCVLVRNGIVVGKGYHEYYGGPHAEIIALTQAGKKARGSTLYVNLEPCNHEGKTPPCTEAILRSGVKRVVAAMSDPNDRGRGGGIHAFARDSIEVSLGVLNKEAVALNADYVRSQNDRGKAVIIKAAMSVDGKIATRNGVSQWISSRHARKYVHRLRSNVDAVIVGKNTVLKDDPALTSHGTGNNPVRVVIDPTLTIPTNRRIFDHDAPTIVFHSLAGAKRKLKELHKKKVVTVFFATRNGQISMTEIIATLEKFSLRKILIEGGGETIASAIESGAATDLVLFIAPIIIGGRSAPSPVDGVGVAELGAAKRLSDVKVSRIGPDFLLRAKIDHSKTIRRKRSYVYRNR